MQTIQEISNAYIGAEITSLFLHDRTADRYINLLTIIEWLPPEQLPSPMVGEQKHSWLERSNVSDELTIYLTRIPIADPQAALATFEEASTGIHLKYDQLKVTLELPYPLVNEPPGFHPLVIHREEKSLGVVLPHRHTGQRVWSWLNQQKDWLKTYDPSLQEGIRKLSTTHLGYDLTAYPEHIGHVYLCAANPVARSWSLTLLEGANILVTSHERAGRSVVGCRLILREERGKKPGFVVDHTLASNRELIELPYDPAAYHLHMLDAEGNLLEHYFGSFLRNFRFDMHMQEEQLDVTYSRKGKTENAVVPKTSKAQTVSVGSYDGSSAAFLQDALETRKKLELEDRKEFFFFPKEPGSVEKATNIVVELLNQASYRCMICDPYFGVDDLHFAFRIQNTSIPVRLISSAAFLGKKVDPDDEESRILHAHSLEESLQSYRLQYSRQTIECKVLRGKKSPLHDRFLVIDNNVYLLGSSLNEFGSRATTLYKVPAPDEMINQAETWWNDEVKCPDLEEYVKQKEES